MGFNSISRRFDEVPALVEHVFSIASGSPQTIRIEIPIEPIDPLRWLHAQTAPIKTYWANRDGDFTMAGIGAAHVARGDDPGPPYDSLFNRLRQGLSCAHPNLRYYGGMCFDASRASDPRWLRWGAYRFLIPRFEVFSTGGNYFFACNAFHAGDASVHEEAETIRRELSQVAFKEAGDLGTLPGILLREDRPGQRSWRATVEKALSAFNETDFTKVVLARESNFEFTGGIDPILLLRKIAAGSPNTYRFAFQTRPGSAFLGASPERLYRRVGGYIQSEAVAGTRPRGDSDESDEAFAEILLHDEKELREHACVADAIREALLALCRDTREEEEVSLVRLQDCQHIARRFEGILGAGVNEAAILAEMHPSPAVGGSSRRAALEWLAREESFDRGWYAGPVGWVGCDSSEFAVGIRSGLVEGASLSLYAGAGIVRGSEPEHEWNEIENKLETFIKALNEDA